MGCSPLLRANGTRRSGPTRSATPAACSTTCSNRARDREDVEIDSIQLGTPASAGPVSLPYVERPPAPPQRVPHPLPDGQRD
jgi:hypothetical protein